MFGGQICVLMDLVVLFLFVPVLRCIILTKSKFSFLLLFNNFVLLITFKIFYIHFLQAYGNFCDVLSSLVVSVTILPSGTRC